MGQLESDKPEDLDRNMWAEDEDKEEEVSGTIPPPFPQELLVFCVCLSPLFLCAVCRVPSCKRRSLVEVVLKMKKLG